MKTFEVATRSLTGAEDVLVVALSGYLDAHAVADFDKRAEEIMTSGTAKLVLDLSGLNYISSAGIGALMGLSQRLKKQGGDLVLLNPTAKVHKILDLLGFSRIFISVPVRTTPGRYFRPDPLCLVKVAMTLPRPLAFELRCPADKSILSWIRGVVVHTATEVGFDDEDLNKIELSVDEACANVIEHAYPDAPDDSFPLIIRLDAEPHGLRITVTDTGIGDHGRPGAVDSVDEYLRVKRYRGLGTYIMQRFMDQVEFSQSPGQGTRVSMVKYISQETRTTTEGR